MPLKEKFTIHSSPRIKRHGLPCRTLGGITSVNQEKSIKEPGEGLGHSLYWDFLEKVKS